MPLIIPELDDRSYQEILNEALARIPVHNPEWTNFNDSDPGVTLVQLFAFMTENLLYRSNLIPERNRLKFLTLLGIPLQPATPAQGIVSFSNARGALQIMTLSAGLEVFAGQTPFRTRDGLDVLPMEARVYYKSHLPKERQAEMETLYTQLYASFQHTGVHFEFYETKPLEPPSSGAVFPVLDLAKDTLDGSLWMALLARSPEDLEQTREAIANKVLTLGILPSLTNATRALRPGGRPSAEGQPNLVYQIPIGGTLPTQVEQRVARYKTLETFATVDLLSEPGVVQLLLPGSNELRLWENLEPLEQGVGNFPPSVEDTDIQDRVVTWVRIRLPEVIPQSGISNQLNARLSWVGINAVRVTQLAHVFSETLGQGTGEPDQVVTLVNTPVIPGSVRLTVNGEPWREIDDLMAADAEVSVRSNRLTPDAPSPPSRSQMARVYTVDRESGEIRFGNGLRGARPPFGAIIQASYDYGGGRQGMVGIDAINKGPTLPAGLRVTNPLPTWGGDEAESVDQAEQLIPRYLRHRDRLVSKEDFEVITWRTPGVDLGRVEVLPLVYPDLPDAPAEGVVTVLVIPLYDPVQPEAPVPDRLFLQAVCEYLNPRRIITTEVYIRGPEYEPLWVSVGIDVVPGRDVAPVREAVKEELRLFLSPLTGGFEQRGWPLEKAVEALELWAVATRVNGVSKVNGVLLAGKTGSKQDRIPMQGLQLPRLVGVAVRAGDPQSVEELSGDLETAMDGAAAAEGAITRVVSIPVIPPECQC